MNRPMRFSSFVVKVASRCNLNCDYCYMYQHADQSWKNKPKVLSEHHRLMFIQRLKEYVLLREQERILIVFHGGEPLLFGADNLVQWANQISKALDEVNCRVDFGIQTNGVLLKEKYLQEFERHRISVSLSIDGPKRIHDSHRLDIKNKPTFDKVYEALLLLRKYPSIFTGCISVIDPNFEPSELFSFFNDNKVAEFNILIPDANYLAPPKGRDKSPNLYKDWLIKAFDVWFDHFSHIKCRFFDELLLGIMGKATKTDSFGLGDISLLVLETDGTYHNHDVLKITEENTSSLGLNLENNPIEEAERSEKIAFHRHLLTKEGLSPQCQECRHVDVCGGGFIAHRFNENGYKNPTIYCKEMYALIDHIIERLYQKVARSSDHWDQEKMEQFWNCSTSVSAICELQDYRARRDYSKLQAFIPFFETKFPSHSEIINKCKNLCYEDVKEVLLNPAVHAWIRAMSGQSVGLPISNIDGKELPLDVDYFYDFYREVVSNSKELLLGSNDRWIRLVMGSNIVLDHPSSVLKTGLECLKKALQILQEYDQKLYEEFLGVNRVVQIVKDSSAHPDKDVSFSDETVPGAIFLSAWDSKGLIDPYIITASLIHEHLHQKLYLLMNRFEMFVDQTTLIYSPWPKVSRPPHGVLHAVYVFTFVAKFWNSMLQNQLVDFSFAHHLETNLEYLGPCINEIKEKVQFTKEGLLFFDLIVKEYESLTSNSFLQRA